MPAPMQTSTSASEQNAPMQTSMPAFEQTAPPQTSMPAFEQTSPSVIKQPSSSLPLAMIFTFTGGFIGAYTCLSRGGVTVNTPRGNLIRLAINLAQNNWANAAPYLCCTVFFLFGIALTSLIRHRGAACESRLHWRQIIVLTSAILLIVVAFLPQSQNLLAVSIGAFVWGCQAETFLEVRRLDGEVIINIGSLHSATQNFCEYSLHGGRHALLEGLTMLGLIVMFVIGAVLATFSVEIWQDYAILVCSGLLLIVFVAMYSEGKSS